MIENYSFQKKIIMFIIICLIIGLIIGLAVGLTQKKSSSSAPSEVPASEPAQAPASEPAQAPASEPAQAPASAPAQAPASAPAQAPASAPAPVPEPALTQVQKIDKNIWQYFNSSYADGERFTLYKDKTTLQDILDNVIKNPLYIAVYIYDGIQTPDGSWQVNYITKENVTSSYDRRGSMNNYEPNNRYIFVHIQKAKDAGVFKN